MRPNEILDSWGVAELIVAFGEYSNEDADKTYQEWKSLPTESRQKIDRPMPYVVRFSEEQWQQNLSESSLT